MGKQQQQNRSEKAEEKNKYPPGLYKRGSSWIVQFVYKGQRYVENVGPVSLTAAKETVIKRKAAAAEGRLEVGKQKIEDLTFEKAMEKYLEWYKANRGAYTYLKYATPASKALKASFDGKRLSQISAFSIEAHKLNRKREPDADHPDRRPVTDSTINHDLTFLRHFFNKCVEWNFAKVNPMKGKVQLFDVDNGRTRHLSAKEAEALLAACAPDLRVLVLAAMHTGFRRSELRSLKWSAVDLVHGAVTVESCYAKNGEPRTVPLTPDLAVAFQKLHDDRKPRPDDVVFIYEGRPWTAWRRSFTSALTRAGITDFRWHDLRHCFGSWLAMNGVPDKGRMELMGHKTAEMTARYTHLSVEYKRKAVASLPQFGKELMESTAELQQISQQSEAANVVSFGR